MDIVKQVKERIEHQFKEDASGHDWYHIERVYQLSMQIHAKEGGNKEIIALAALLHDISDYKLNGGIHDVGGKVAFDILSDLNYDLEKSKIIADIIDAVSFKGAKVQDKMFSLEGMIVQDADRLDAIGAIGIGRTFAYGGHKGQPMYTPDLEPVHHDTFNAYANSKTTTINHFHEKLLLLADRMHTGTAKKIAKHRHKVMEDFLNEFLLEWNGQLDLNEQ